MDFYKLEHIYNNIDLLWFDNIKNPYPHYIMRLFLNPERRLFS